MKLEEQVCSLEYAKKLKELGVPQESLWKYDTLHNDKLVIDPFGYCDGYISAFTVSELGEGLQNDIWGLLEFIQENNDELWFEYCNTPKPLFNPNFLAKMRIYLLENKLVTPK